MLTLSVYFRSIKQTIRSPARIALIIGFPLGFAAVFAFIFGGGDPGTSSSFSIGVINADDESMIASWQDEFVNYTKPWSENSTLNPLTHGFGNFFIECLSGRTSLVITNKTFKIIEFDSPSESLLAVRSRAISLAVNIHFDFSLGMLSGINSRENIINGAPVVDDDLIRNRNLTIDLLGDPSYMVFQNVRTEFESALEIFKSYFFGIELNAGIISSDYQSITSSELSQYDYFLSGFFTFGLVISASSIAGILGNERTDQTLDRLKLSQMKPTEYLLGIGLAQITTSGIQLAMMFLAAYLFGFKGIGNPFSAYIVSLITILPILGLGFFVSALVPNGSDANGVIAVLSAPIGFLSGSFLEVPSIPLIANIIPDGLGGFRDLNLWDFFPFAPSVSAIRKILLFNYSLEQVIPELFFLVIGGLIFFLFGIIFFVWKIFKPEK